MAFVGSACGSPFAAVSTRHAEVGAKPRAFSRQCVRAGYGDYSYSTDKTQGHLNNYYIDKYRTTSDLGTKHSLAGAEPAMGRNAKGGVLVPKFGIPQMDDDVLGFGPDSMVDPRIAEAEGSQYPWDPAYVDESKTLASCADIDDPAVSDNAFSSFLSASSVERSQMILACERATESTIKEIKSGMVDEMTMLSASGQRLAQYARTEKIATLPMWTPTGEPQTEIPGTPFKESIGALDYQSTSDVIGTETMGAFWKTPTEAPTYKKPLGAATPEPLYNSSPRLPSSE
eukprot:CAMPEP_0185844526 /NCGR_PEP_ID=MMETSP1354-20130828/657_1 /TAXON_ID=708628 /ORGANISM="Erythrolobus madagascarensis, Strain CCMP3276" /LENGTH=285 /DNA_ID=CAMNT_0028544205 /DNA_START=47 /DNA_END=904 /DNA_ORIENTATION=+